MSTMNDPVYDRYWLNYAWGMQWIQRHRVAYEVVSSHSIPNFPSSIAVRRRGRKSKWQQSKRAKSHHASQSSSTTNFDQPGCSQEGSQEEAELDPEVVDFFRKTAQHRKDRELVKLMEDGSKLPNKKQPWYCELPDDYISLAKIGVNTNLAASLLPPNSEASRKKDEKYEKLYGDCAERIRKVETRLQMKFDEAMDRLNPQLWPNIPLKM